MTYKTNARIAGVTLLLYIATGITQMVVGGPASRGDGPAARLASMARYAANVRTSVLLGLLTCFIALALGVALHAITREQDRDLALLALACRICEGALGAVFIPITLALLSLGTSAAANAPASLEAQALASFFFAARRLNPIICATFFAVGSTIFSYLLLRGRLVPVALSWTGIVASVLLVVALPLQLTGMLAGGTAQLLWLPMAVFEIALALWLLIKGVATDSQPMPT